jgi:hypothetical protein
MMFLFCTLRFLVLSPRVTVALSGMANIDLQLLSPSLSPLLAAQAGGRCPLGHA